MARRRESKQEPSVILVIILVGIAAIALLGNSNFNNDGTNLLIAILVLGILVGLIGLGFFWWLDIQKSKALRALKIADVNAMTGVEFEHYVGAVLKSRGYHITYTNVTGDFGVDLVARKDKIATAIQVKRYAGSVGEAAVQQAFAGMLHYKCTKAMVITNSSFTKHAKALAQTTHCELVDGLKLGEWIAAFQSAN